MATLSPATATRVSSAARSSRKSIVTMSFPASEPVARASGYQRLLLNALRRQRQKMPFKLPDDHQGHSLAVSSVSSSLNLENYRERFETQLLKVLWQYDLEDEDVGLLSPETAQLLQDNLERLCVLLNEVANDDLQCSAGEETPERTLPVSPTGYPRLEKVLFRAEQSKGPLELATGSTLSLFKLDTLAIALGAHSVVKEFSRSLNAVRGTSSTGRGYAPTTRESRKTQATPHAWLHTFDRSYRAYLGSILDTLKSDFSKCVEPDHVESATHELRLQLLNLESLNQPVSSIKPNLLVYCPKSESWQNAVCHIHSNHASGSARLCRLLAESLRRGDGLVLGFSDAHKTFTRNTDTLPPLEQDPGLYPKLTSLIHQCRAFGLPGARDERGRSFTYSERRTLAAQLALDLLICCNWHHSSRPWDGNEIYFPGSSLWDYEKGKPYLSYFAGSGPPADAHVEPNDDADDGAPIPSFTKFAKLLLELEYGPFPLGDYGPKSDYGYRRIKEFYQRQRAFGDLSRESYLKAIDTCLQFDRLLNIERSKALGKLQTDEEICRRLIRERIVANILKDLQPPARVPRKRPRRSQAVSTDDDDSQDTDWNRRPGSQVRDGCNTGNPGRRPLAPLQKRLRLTGYTAAGSITVQGSCLSPQEATAGSTSKTEVKQKRTVAFVTTREVSTPTIALPTPAAPRNTPNAAALFDSATLPTPSETTTSAARWFEILAEKVNPIVDKRRRAGDRAVKVAVLDTGLDITHGRIRYHLEKHGSKITDRQDWSESPHGADDHVGHGTAVCDVLLRTAKVHLFVGKVSDEATFDEKVPARIAQAISHAAAADKWNVDIIVLSLGFENEDQAIRKAIREAANKDKVILAAASNSGSIDPTKRVSFPARMSGEVISVRSATGHGERAAASPRRSDGDDNFAILGEGIEAAWPTHLNHGQLTRLVSGTSFATPLAAGVAALMMEFSMQKGIRGAPNLNDDLQHVLMQYRGIRKMFEHMSVTQDNSFNVDCRIIYPWRLFDPDMKYEGIAYTIEQQLKNAS